MAETQHPAVLALQRGNPAEAERLARIALERNPGDTEALVAAGIAAAQQGRTQEARGYLESAVDRNPSRVDAWVALSKVVARTDPILAVDHAARAASLEPEDAELQFHLGLTGASAGRFDIAAQAFGAAVRIQPANPNFLRNLALALRDSGRESDSVQVWERLVELDRRNLANWVNLAQLYLAHGRFEEAIRAAESILRQSSAHATAHLIKALALSEEGRGGEAEPHLQKAIKLEPRQAVAHAALGFWLQEQGRFEEAQPRLEEAIRLNPQHGFAYYNLFRARKATAADRPLLAEIARIARDPKLHPRDRGYLQYALGKAHEDLGEYEEAMRGYDLGNEAAYEVWLSRRPWNRQEYADGFARTREIFHRETLPKLADQGDPDALPVMIVGMIRSGTSLLEQILSSHPQIAGAGELPFWHQHEARAFQNGRPEPECLRELAEEYSARLRRFAPEAARVTDKLPHNFAMLGLIHAALPNAKMIHVRRNPADNCLSVYTTAYQRPPVFAHSRENIVFAYREYLKLMEHWREHLPQGVLMEVEYEDLVANREPLLRSMLEFLGLEWDDACLQHQHNRRAVRTPSLWQVRQPIYTTSIARWKRFEPWIREFAALDNGDPAR